MPSGHDDAVGVLAECGGEDGGLALISIGVGEQPDQVGGAIADQHGVGRQAVQGADFFAQALAAAVRVTGQKGAANFILNSLDHRLRRAIVVDVRRKVDDFGGVQPQRI